MVNDEHYARLEKGVEAWNEWRQKNPKIIIDLMEANLMEANLMEANLRKANLSGANLMEANLRKADLSGANLRKANLMEANLIEANLRGADFCQAALMEANLSGIDLRKVYLKGANLSGADLSGANLSWVNLSGANLVEADLSDANLRGANLSRANLSRANLSRANLSRADLSGATFTGIDLSGVDLSEVDLSRYDLSRANLSRANLSGANLVEADLSEANLNEANLSRANLVEADLFLTNLSGANLVEADLSEANLNEANLSRANLKGADLSRTQVLGTELTGANLTGACLEDWHINYATNLDDIDCQYVYRKNDKQGRYPSSGEFAPGGFTKFFQKALETVDLIFADGIDWKAFLLSFQELQAEYGEENLSVQAFEKKSGGAFVIRIEVSPEANSAEIECSIKERYKEKQKKLKVKYCEKLQYKEEQIIFYKEQNAMMINLVKLMAATPIQNFIDVKATSESKSMSESYQSKYDQRNSNNQFVDTAQSGSNPTFNQSNYAPEQRQNLAEAAADIQQLLNQLAQTNPRTDVVTEAVHQKIKTDPTFKARLLAALKAGGIEALKAIFNHPAFSIPVETIKGFLEAE